MRSERTIATALGRGLVAGVLFLGAVAAPATERKAASSDEAAIRAMWLIAHEHLSVPVDPATGQADFLSKP